MKTSSPAETVGSIDDLLTEFFIRIPLKPLFRLKLVSKHWNSLISNVPKLHSNKKPVGFIFQIPDPRVEFGNENAYVLSLDRSSPVGPPSITELEFAREYLHDTYKEKEVGNKICHSCNGLLVGYLCEYLEDDPGEYEIKDYFVRNPTTGEHKSVPRQRGLGLIHWMYLAFDPSISPHYKIVCVLSNRGQYRFAVYSSKTRSWQKYDNRFGDEFMDFEKGVYWNGSIHWINLSETEKSIYFSPPDHDDDDDDQNVVDDDEYDSDFDYYDCYDDRDSGHHLTVLEMPTPPTLGEMSNNYLGESGDHLNFISYYSEDEYKFKVYEMRRDYSEWFVKYSVDVSNVWCPVGNEGLEGSGSFAVCGLVRCKKGDDNKDDSFLVLLIEGRVLVFNVVNGTFEMISEFDEDSYDEGYDLFYDFWRDLKQSTGFFLYCPLQYIESLCLV